MIKSREYIAKNLPKDLINDGMSFKNFYHESKGIFLDKDVDWNYKDILHPRLVHKLLDQTHIYTNDYTTNQIFFQKIGFFKLPFQVIQFDVNINTIAYCFTIFGFVIYIETEYTTKNKLTLVKTTYHIGSLSKFLLNLTFPFFKYLLSKNYKKLMSEDMPLRERKGVLRSWGITFKTDQYTKISYNDCKNISFNNVIFTNKFKPKLANKVLINKKNNLIESFLIGRSDNYGLRGEINNDIISFYPRICSHEGACLDKSQPSKNNAIKYISCPWHGKKIKPIFNHNFKLSNNFEFNYSGKTYQFKVNGNEKIKNISVKIT